VHQFLPPRADLESLNSGSGTGFYLDRWQELGFPNVHASHVSEVAVQRLRERYPSCESPSSTSRAFANLASLVKPDGLLVFSENFLHHRNPGRPYRLIVRSPRSSFC
jgi:hypothetical protein